MKLADLTEQASQAALLRNMSAGERRRLILKIELMKTFSTFIDSDTSAAHATAELSAVSLLVILSILKRTHMTKAGCLDLIAEMWETVPV